VKEVKRVRGRVAERGGECVSERARGEKGRRRDRGGVEELVASNYRSGQVPLT
jgi:hypothetical protein